MIPEIKPSVIRGGMSFDGSVGSLGSLPYTEPIIDILISCKAGEEGFEDRSRAKATEQGIILKDEIVKNRMGGLEYRAKVKTVKREKQGIILPFTKEQIEAAKISKGIIEEKKQETNSCMLGQ